MARLRILNAEPGRFSVEARAALDLLGDVDEVEADRAFLLEHLGVYDVVIVALRNTFDAELLGRAARLRCIVTPTTGLDHIDMRHAAERGIDVLSLRGETAFLNDVSATAELAWGLLLALLRRIPAANADVAAGRWRRNEFCGHELKGKTLGIVGHGRLGRMVARYGVAFRMDVLAFDRVPDAVAEGVQFVELTELLARSDVVSLHLPLNDETRGFIDARALRAMRPGAVLVNTARGEIVDQDALLDALRDGHLAGVAADVLAGETSLDGGWLARNELAAHARSHGNVILTPHIGGVTHESVAQTNLFIIRKLSNYLEGQEPS
jgi:D-3-phosphoglycerate dehydrogenase / 2-oxoglutarate reductase